MNVLSQKNIQAEEYAHLRDFLSFNTASYLDYRSAVICSTWNVDWEESKKICARNVLEYGMLKLNSKTRRKLNCRLEENLWYHTLNAFFK